MKTKKPYIIAVLSTILLSACVPIQALSPTTSQPPLPTVVQLTEPTNTDPTTAEPTQGEVIGPEVFQLGDLTMEVYELLAQAPTDDGSFKTTVGPSSEILITRRPLRDVMDQPFSPPPVNGRQLTAKEEFTEGKMVVIVKLNDEEVLSVDCGEPSPMNNLRGTWVIRDDWYVEVVHTDSETNENYPTRYGIGEIFLNGVSLNEQYGYEETFGFQPLDDKPFYFFSKNGEIGIHYDGEVSMLGFDRVWHYACCSGAAFNPKAYLTMVTFFASKGETNYYIELGLFSAFDLDILDLSGAGLTVDAFELQDGSWPDEEHHQSRPTGSLPGWVMKRHETERKDIIPYQINSPLFEGKELSTKTSIDYTNAIVEVTLGDEVVLRVPVGDLTHWAAMGPVMGVWVSGEHWYMEMYHVEVEYETDGNIFRGTTLGEIFRSGESLSELYGYDETFGFQILADKPIYFFKKDGELGLNYAGEEVMLGFDEVAHHHCCGFSIYNPMHYEDMVAFFASKEGVRYYVEVGVFE